MSRAIVLSCLFVTACSESGTYPFSDRCGADVEACDLRDSECSTSWFTFTTCIREVEAAEPPQFNVISVEDATRRFAGGTESSTATQIRKVLALATLLDERDTEPSAFASASFAGTVAFYSNREKAIYVIDRGVPLEEYADVLVHESVHALQDRERGFANLYERWAQDDDQALALQSMIEGEANFYQAFAYSVLEGTGFVPADLGPPAGLLEATARAASPLIVTHNTFPYLFGERYVASAFASGQTAAVRELFDNPPRSTLQLVAGYFPDQARSSTTALSRRIPSPPFGGELASYRWIADLTLGAWIGRVFFLRNGEGDVYWQGDRFLCFFDQATGARAFLWATATAFADATLPAVRPPFSLVARPGAVVVWGATEPSTGVQMKALAERWADDITTR